MTGMFSPAGLKTWTLGAARPGTAPLRDELDRLRDLREAASQRAHVPVDDDAPAVRLATPEELRAGDALLELAERCGVPASYAPLLSVLHSATSEPVELVIANGQNGQDDAPALIAVERSGVAVVDPSLAIPGKRGQVLSQPYSSITRAKLVRGAVGGRRARWFVLEAATSVRIELSRDAWEAASQLVYVINQRVEATARRTRRSADPHAVAG